MAQMHSANDPIFWHHYPYLDYLGSLRGTYSKGRSSSNKTKFKKYEIFRLFKNILIESIVYKPHKSIKAQMTELNSQIGLY